MKPIPLQTPCRYGGFYSILILTVDCFITNSKCSITYLTQCFYLIYFLKVNFVQNSYAFLYKPLSTSLQSLDQRRKNMFYSGVVFSACGRIAYAPQSLTSLTYFKFQSLSQLSLPYRHHVFNTEPMGAQHTHKS